MEIRESALRLSAKEAVSKTVAAVASAALIASLSPAVAPQRAEAAETSGSCGTCSWELDDGVLTIAPADGESGTLDSFSDPEEVPWHDNAASIESVVVEDGVAAGESADYMFYGCESLVETGSLDNLDVSGVETMSSMFSGCTHLFSVDLSSWDVSNVRDMGAMFMDCFRERDRIPEVTLDLTSWDVSSLESADFLFYGCKFVGTIDVSGWDTSNVTNMRCTFSNCLFTGYIDVSDWDVSNVKSMEGIFGGDMCLEELDVSDWDVSNVTDMQSAFYECGAPEIDVSDWDVSNVTDMVDMFYCCANVEELDVSDWDVSNVKSMYAMFWNCSLLESLDVSGWDTSNVTDMTGMFQSCDSLSSLDLSSFDTSSVTDMNIMFRSCDSLSSLDLSSFDTSSVTDMNDMFRSCDSLSSLDVSSFDTSSVTDMSGMFQSCESLSSLDVSSFDTSSVTDAGYMFFECSSIRSVTVGSSFAFVDSDGYLPVPLSGTIEGKWRDSDGTIYDKPSALPDNVDTTYTAVFETAPGSGVYSADDPDRISLSKGKVTLSKTSFAYNGSKRGPTVTVKVNGRKLERGSDYTLITRPSNGKTYYSGSKVEDIDVYTVVVEGTGYYKGTVKKTFRIVPGKAKLKSVKVGKKKVTVSWKKQTGGVKYQVAYKAKNAKKWKKVTVKGTKRTFQPRVKVKKYQVKVRALKKTDKGTCYGAWSKTKTVKTKKSK